MRRLMVLVLVFVGGLLLACSPLGGIASTGRVATRAYDVSDFAVVEAGSAFEVVISPGDGYGLTITAPESRFRDIRVSRTGDTLRIDLAPARGFTFGRTTLRAEVTMPAIEGVSLSGATRGTVAGFGRAPEFRAELSGASRLEGEVDANAIELDLSGASTLDLVGRADTLVAEASGASRINLAGFPVTMASIELSGASNASLNVAGGLEYDLSGGSTLRYGGDPAVTRAELSGGSRAIPEG